MSRIDCYPSWPPPLFSGWTISLNALCLLLKTKNQIYIFYFHPYNDEPLEQGLDPGVKVGHGGVELLLLPVVPAYRLPGVLPSPCCLKQKKDSKKSAKFSLKTYFFEISPPVFLHLSFSVCEMFCPNRNSRSHGCLLKCFCTYTIQRISMCRSIG